MSEAAAEALEKWFPHARQARYFDDLLYAEFSPNHRASTLFYEGEPIALLEEHVDPRGDWCPGTVALPGYPGIGRQTWTIEQESPLTLSPSILCRICGSHGFIQEGEWVEA